MNECTGQQFINPALERYLPPLLWKRAETGKYTHSQGHSGRSSCCSEQSQLYPSLDHTSELVSYQTAEDDVNQVRKYED
jgi:hypothetical protein